jgi:hypothetical protein
MSREFECATHGVKQLRVAWGEAGSQFTVLFERLAIDLLRECSVTGAGRLLRIRWDEAWGIKGPLPTRKPVEPLLLLAMIPSARECACMASTVTCSHFPNKPR